MFHTGSQHMRGCWKAPQWGSFSVGCHFFSILTRNQDFFAFNAVIFFIFYVMTWTYTVGCSCTATTFLHHSGDLCWEVCCRKLLLIRHCESLTASKEHHISILFLKDCLSKRNDSSGTAVSGKMPLKCIMFMFKWQSPLAAVVIMTPGAPEPRGESGDFVLKPVSPQREEAGVNGWVNKRLDCYFPVSHLHSTMISRSCDLSLNLIA